MSSLRSLRFIALLTILLFVVSCAITEERKVTYTTYQSGAGAVAWSPEGRHFAVKEVIRIIALPSQEVIETLDPAGGMTCDLRFSPDGQFLLIANQRGAHVYDTTTWEVKRLKLSSL